MRIQLKNMIQEGYKFLTFRILFPCFYKICCIRPVKDNKVLFVEVYADKPDPSFRMVFKWIGKKRPDAECHVVYMKYKRTGKLGYFKNCMSLLFELSNSRIVFISEACNIIGAVEKRKETKVIQLWHGCGAFKKFGFSTVDLLWGAGKKEIEKYPNYRNMDMVTVSSPEVIWAYEEAMGIEKEKICPVGVSRTDIFFSRKFRCKSRDKFLKLFPDENGKKVILYAPTFRGHLKEAETCVEFPYERFCERFGGNVVLLVKHHPFVVNKPEVPEKCRNMVIDVSDSMEIDELICISDMCISDYSSLIFEYSLMEKPMVFFVPDIEDYQDWRGFYYPYEEMTPGPVCREPEALLDAVEDSLEKYDVEQIKAFRAKFMSACDGHATERIMRYAWSEKNTDTQQY